MKEKRIGKRVRKSDNLVIEIIAHEKSLEGKKIHYTLTKNMSLDGVNIRSNTFLPIDTVVDITLNSKKVRKAICIRAKVRWIKSLYDDETFEIGLAFVDTPPQVIRSLLGHLYGQ